jgi:hypothetical protein
MMMTESEIEKGEEAAPAGTSPAKQGRTAIAAELSAGILFPDEVRSAVSVLRKAP